MNDNNYDSSWSDYSFFYVDLHDSITYEPIENFSGIRVEIIHDSSDTQLYSITIDNVPEGEYEVNIEGSDDFGGMKFINGLLQVNDENITLKPKINPVITINCGDGVIK